MDNSLEWAFSGKEEIVERLADHSMSSAPRVSKTDFPLATYRWTHIIDSQGYTQADVGNIPHVPQEEFRETGKVPHPVTGIETSFEECWRQLKPTSITRFPYAFILQSRDGKAFLAQIGGRFQAMRQGGEGEKFAAVRQVWDEENCYWTTQHETSGGISLAKLPFASVVGDVDWTTAAVGDEVQLLSEVFIIRALVKIPT